MDTGCCIEDLPGGKMKENPDSQCDLIKKKRWKDEEKTENTFDRPKWNSNKASMENLVNSISTFEISNECVRPYGKLNYNLFFFFFSSAFFKKKMICIILKPFFNLQTKSKFVYENCLLQFKKVERERDYTWTRDFKFHLKYKSAFIIFSSFLLISFIFLFFFSQWRFLYSRAVYFGVKFIRLSKRHYQRPTSQKNKEEKNAMKLNSLK